jgi:SAM-dependent methyltransferase
LSSLIDHYSGPDLASRVLQLTGKADPAVADLAAYDEFHVGGRPATLAFAEKLGLKAGMRLLDIGCGIGGAARTVAHYANIHVTGLDLSPDYIAAAKTLSAACGLSSETEFHQGDATSLPFADDAFDAAYSIHAAMNVRDKNVLYAEARRVLKTGSCFGLYDVMAGTEEGMAWPVPWAAEAGMSFLIPLETLEEILKRSGFAIEAREECTGRAIQSLTRPAGPGIRLLMGEDADRKITNLRDNLNAGHCTLWQVVARAV